MFNTDALWKKFILHLGKCAVENLTDMEGTAIAFILLIHSTIH
jgi:hypothetical protein